MEKLKQHWGLTTNWRLLTVIIVFAINGSFAAWVSKPVTEFFGLKFRNNKSLCFIFSSKTSSGFSNLSVDFTYCRLGFWGIQILLGI